MDSSDLTPEQAQRMGAVIGRHLRYLHRLRERMNVMGFPPTDPLFVVVTEAYNATHALSVRYDLRATPDRCPECGAAPAKTGT